MSEHTCEVQSEDCPACEYPAYLDGLGEELAYTGADSPMSWSARLAWNLTLAALLQTAARRAVLAADVAWLDVPLDAKTLATCNEADKATKEWT